MKLRTKFLFLNTNHQIFSLKYQKKIVLKILQLAHVNLNHMICPAILDPFQGDNYRLMACMHQALLCPIITKFFGYVFSPKDALSTEYSPRAPDDLNNGLKHRHNENNLRIVNKKQNENGCDIGNSLLGDTLMKCPNSSNKKTH